MNTTKVKIFIASSAELKQERKECILHLNTVNKIHSHLRLEPIEWEYDLYHGSYPDFADIQKAINPLLEECTLCVFIFHSKIGKYTRQEFELANSQKKPLFTYFREGFSPKTKDENALYGELIEFKQSLNDTVLYEDYLSNSDFELLLKDNLHRYLSMKFPIKCYVENKPLSEESTTLLKILNEKQQEIEQLKSSLLSLTDQEAENKLKSLEHEKNNLLEELNNSKEIQEQQAKEKEELVSRLAPQIARDNLKEKAFTAIQENKYDDAEKLLKESAKDSISETASTFYELGKLKKIQLLYQEALKYFELAVKIDSTNFEMIVQFGTMLKDLGYNNKAI